MMANEEVTILVIGDPHMKDNNDEESKLLINNIIQIIDEHPEIDLVVDLGDTLDKHNVAYVVPYNNAYNLFKEIIERKPLVVLIGNHDLPTQREFLSDMHFFGPMKLWPNTTIVDTKCEIIEIKEKKFAFIPYTTPGTLDAALNSNPCYKEEEITAVFCHHEIRGCDVAKKSKNADVWNPNRPLLVCGHIHKHHLISTNVLYAGTPRQTDFGDKLDVGERKTVSILTFGSSCWNETRIPTNIPEIIECNISVSEINNWIPPETGTIKIKIRGSYVENKLAKKSAVVKSWVKRGILVTYEDVCEASISIVNNGTNGSNSNSTNDFIGILDERCKRHNRLESIHQRLTFEFK